MNLGITKKFTIMRAEDNFKTRASVISWVMWIRLRLVTDGRFNRKITLQ